MDGTTVSGDFTNIETLNLTFTDGKAARVELYKSQLPSVSFTLNGVTLDEIQAGSKDVKYKGNSVTISQAGGSDPIPMLSSRAAATPPGRWTSVPTSSSSAAKPRYWAWIKPKPGC